MLRTRFLGLLLVLAFLPILVLLASGRDDAAAMTASRSAYSTDEMALSSVHSSFRNFRVLLIAFPFLAVLSVELAR